MDDIDTPIKLTKYSRSGGCGCKISPATLDSILKSRFNLPDFSSLIVGNACKDDAAVYDTGHGEGIISTTDFFMPIVDDPEDFGRVAATNAINDIYAMGGTPIMAIAILGWPVDKLPSEVARKVIDGGRQICADASIPLAGGHSINSQEPIFGLAVTGKVILKYLKKNSTAQPGDHLYLTKPLGIGILTTAGKKQKLAINHSYIALEAMCTLNRIGQDLALIEGVNGMTDVTGFGLLGHLIEMCEGSNLKATLYFDQLPILPFVNHYQSLNCISGGTARNYESYGHKVSPISEQQKQLICDPQTSGGLLVAVSEQYDSEFHDAAAQYGLELERIGVLSNRKQHKLIEVI